MQKYHQIIIIFLVIALIMQCGYNCVYISLVIKEETLIAVSVNITSIFESQAQFLSFPACPFTIKRKVSEVS